MRNIDKEENDIFKKIEKKNNPKKEWAFAEKNGICAQEDNSYSCIDNNRHRRIKKVIYISKKPPIDRYQPYQ